MIRDAATLDASVALDADVCVVGTGTAGCAAVDALAAAGLSVVALEEGGAALPSPDELHARRTRLREDGFQATSDAGVTVVQGCLLGGSAELGPMTSWRVPDEILGRWSTRRGVAALAPEEMAIRYAAVERELGAAPPGVSPDGGGLREAAHRLGWSTTVPPASTEGCAACGTCLLGCRAGRVTPRTAWLEPAAARGADVLLHARVGRILLEAGRAAEVRAQVRGRAATRLTVRADAVVLAAGALASPSMLIEARVPNRHRQLGVGLVLHPTAPVVGLFDEAPDPAVGWAVTRFTDGLGEEPDGLLLQRQAWTPGFLASFLPLRGDALARVMMQRERLAVLGAAVRDRRAGWVVPMPGGRPVPRVETSPRDRRALAAGIERAARLLLTAGASEVWTPHTAAEPIRSQADLARIARRPRRACDLALISTDPAGGAPMGDDPRRSVTDGGGRVRGVDGLYVADAALLPGAAGVPLGATVAALARHVAATVLADLGRGGG